jgi:hypothetical protein
LPDVVSVAKARKKVATAYKSLLKSRYGRQLAEMGSKKTRAQLGEISYETGTWADGNDRSKPRAWLVDLTLDDATKHWVAGPGDSPANPHWKRLCGSFNTKSPLQGVLIRVLPVFSTPELGTGSDSQDYFDHPYWEWALAFVFPGAAVFVDAGSSGATIDFDPRSGTLTSKDMQQEYVAAGLFKLVPDDDAFTIGGHTFTYGEISESLRAFMTISPIQVAPDAESSHGDN